MSKSETANLTQAIASSVTAQFGFRGVIVTVLDSEGRFFVAAAMVDEQRTKFLSTIASATATLIEKHEKGHAMAVAPHLTGGSELAAAKQRIAQLEVELADARCDRAEVIPVWTPAPKEVDRG